MENKEMQKKEMVPGITSTAPEGNHLAPIKKAIEKYGIPSTIYLDQVGEVKFGQ